MKNVIKLMSTPSLVTYKIMHVSMLSFTLQGYV